MSKKFYRQGPKTFPVKTGTIEKFRLVKVDSEGISYADASGPVWGAVAQTGAKPEERAANDLTYGRPAHLAVHTGPESVPLEVTSSPEGIKAGAAVYADANGKVAASGNTLVGYAVEDGVAGDNFVTVHLVTPVKGS